MQVEHGQVINNPSQIDKHLNTMAASHEQVQVWTMSNTNRQQYQGMILRSEQKEDTVLLGNLSTMARNNLSHQRQVLIKGMIGGIEVYFQTELHNTQDEHDSALLLRWPHEIYRIQQRGAKRLTLTEKGPICMVTLDGGELGMLAGCMLNISLTGMCIQTQSKVADKLPTDTSLRAHFEIPEFGEVNSEVTVSWIQKNGAGKWDIGCQFGRLPAAARRAIAILVAGSKTTYLRRIAVNLREATVGHKPEDEIFSGITTQDLTDLCADYLGEIIHA